ncbi:MAG: hypothetical protein RBJ76_08130 [Stenomitos frigidus ULC029]
MNCLQKQQLQKQQSVEQPDQVIAVSDQSIVVTTDLLPVMGWKSVLIHLPMSLVGLSEIPLLDW